MRNHPKLACMILLVSGMLGFLGTISAVFAQQERTNLSYIYENDPSFNADSDCTVDTELSELSSSLNELIDAFAKYQHSEHIKLSSIYQLKSTIVADPVMIHYLKRLKSKKINLQNNPFQLDALITSLKLATPPPSRT